MTYNKLKLATILSTELFAMFLIASLLSVGNAWYGHYTINYTASGITASRCDHRLYPPQQEGNAWTGCGINANWDVPNESYGSGIFSFQRGHGYEDSYTWNITNAPLYCHYVLDSTWTWYGYYDYGSTSWHKQDAYHWWDAWYHNSMTTINPISPYYDGYTLGCYAGSYFKEVSNPNNQVFISSTISPADMYADDPDIKNEEHW